MKQIIIFILTLASLNCFSQNSLSDTISIVNDFNNDNISDSLTIYTFRKTTESIKVYNSLTKQSFTIGGRGSYNWSKANFLEIIPLPEELVIPANEILLDTIIQYLLPNFSEPDPSLDWLIAGYQNKVIDTTDNLFSMTLTCPISKHDTFSYPEASFKIISKDTLPVFWDRVCSENYIKYKHGILVYYGQNHRSRDFEFQTDTISNNYEIFSTSHGILAKKEQKYSWLFITDGTLTGGPEKLRWKSIIKIKYFNNHIILHQVSGIGDYNKIFIINPENGKIGLLRIEDEYFCFNSPKCFDFEVKESKLIINSRRTQECYYDKGDIETLSFDMKLIIEKLK
ncbi:hypothetical protein [uncultured Psychroserpens sp.]|uniref:hypothetical protein n=1 Tax=uncultured Psychroserpens sp. TaxID=255436 RepID=UPI002637449F|nr:hypothetical protein [uncultured Psychroserpens sp.]